MSAKHVVRYGTMRVLGHFETHTDNSLDRGTRVIVRTQRGLEVGEVLCPAGDRTGQFLTDDQGGQVLRVLTSDDEREVDRIRDGERDEFDLARRMVADRKLQMALVDIEHLFGGERVVLYYLAENRVDFRELVRALAGEFQTRVEMRQIGVRDEAKLLADYGDCGKPVCCNTHLAKMPPVSMKMAKLQKSTLDPSKISGRCGRLKCCLRYEHDTYEEHQRELPPVGSRVITKQGNGQVLAHEVLARRVLVAFEDGRRVPVAHGDVVTVLTGGRKDNPPTAARESQN
jgi:cell fate regulator YaaT (PSP1 superfamily)